MNIKVSFNLCVAVFLVCASFMFIENTVIFAGYWFLAGMNFSCYLLDKK